MSLTVFNACRKPTSLASLIDVGKEDISKMTQERELEQHEEEQEQEHEIHEQHEGEAPVDSGVAGGSV
jgi:hypothetical protein